MSWSLGLLYADCCIAMAVQEKKNVQVAKQRCLEYRGAFMADVLQYRRDMFVFVDETGSNNRDCTRKFGYFIRGEAPVYHRWLVRGRRISAIAAITTDGVLDYELTLDSVNGDKFLDFVRGSLIPNMNPFDGISSKSIVVMDNCSVHHTQEVRDELRNAGVLVIFLLPYSPDYMPIELCFSYIKYYLKSHDDLLQTVSDPKPIISTAFQSVTSDQCISWINHCGVNEKKSQNSKNSTSHLLYVRHNLVLYFFVLFFSDNTPFLQGMPLIQLRHTFRSHVDPFARGHSRTSGSHSAFGLYSKKKRLSGGDSYDSCLWS